MRGRTITRVRVLRQSTYYELTTSINTWLAEQGPGFQLVDIKYSSMKGIVGEVYSALVIYTELEPLEDDGEEAPANE